MQQNDHLVILEEDEAKVIAKEVTLDKGSGGTILIEPLLNPLLLHPPPVVKLDAIQEVLIEDSSSTHSTHPVMLTSKQANKCAYGQHMRRTLMMTTVFSSSSMWSSFILNAL